MAPFSAADANSEVEWVVSTKFLLYKKIMVISSNPGMPGKAGIFSREFKVSVIRRMLAGENVSAIARELQVRRKDL